MRKIVQFAAVAALALSATQAGAVTLAAGGNPVGGTTSAAQPQLAGTIVEDETAAVAWTVDGGTLSANVQSRVVHADDGTYDFYWRITDTAYSGNANGSQPAIGTFRIGDFGSSIVGLNGDYRTDGLGSVGPDSIRVFTGAFDGFANFIFDRGLQPGSDSYFMFLDTSATHYAKTAIFDLTNIGQTQNSGLFSTFGVSGAVPEPAAWAMMLLGFFGMGGLVRARRRYAIA